MIKKLWDEYLLYKKLMHMDEGNNISCEMLGKTKVTAAVVKEWLPPRKELVSLVSVAKPFHFPPMASKQH